jgi:hypothetical protein
MLKPNVIKSFLLGFATIGALSCITNASAAAPTGVCGMVASLPHPEFNFLTYSGTAPVVKNLDVLAEINFTTSTIYYSVTQWTFDGAGNVGKQTIGGNAAFILTGPALTTGTGYASGNPTPNSYQIAFTLNAAGGAKPVILNVLPVNSGNTYLIQGIADRLSGVCQTF